MDIVSSYGYKKISHDGSWNPGELRRFASGEKIDRNGKRYGLCFECMSIIRTDKLFFGSIHFCTED